MRRNMMALFAVTAIVAGCGSQAKVTTGGQLEPAAVPEVALSKTQPAAAGATPPDDDPVVAVRRDKSLEGARPDGREVRRRTRIQESRLLKDCLAARGISFDGVLQPNVDEGKGDHTFWLPIQGAVDAKKNGFQQREDLSGGSIRPTDPKLLAALEGDDKEDKGCRSSVGDQLANLGVEATRQAYSELVATFQNRQTGSIESDPGIPATTAQWKVCMIAEGISDTTDRRDLLRKYLSAPTLTEHERTAAVADAKCAASSGLNDLLLRASESAAVQIVQEQGAKIKALKEADKALLLKLPPS